MVLVREGRSIQAPAHLVQNPLDHPLHPHSVPNATAGGRRLAQAFARRWNISGGEPEIVYASGPRAAARSTLSLMFKGLPIGQHEPPTRIHAELEDAHHRVFDLSGNEAGQRVRATESPRAAIDQAMPLVHHLVGTAHRIEQPYGLLTVTVLVGDATILEGVMQVLTEGVYNEAAHLTVLKEGDPVFLVMDPGRRYFRKL